MAESNTRTHKIGLALIVALLMTVSGMMPNAYAASPVSLGKSGNYTLLAQATIVTTGATAITGNVGLSPANSSALVGFSLSLDPSGSFANSPLVTGKVEANNYGDVTQATLLAAISEMRNAFTLAEGRTSTVSEGTTALNGQDLPAGVYKWTGNVAMTGSITLTGNSSDVWIFQMPGTMTVSNGVAVKLSGGATYNNVFWQVLGITTVGKAVNFQGIVLDASDIFMQTGATLTGRLLSEMGISLEANTIAAPAVATSTTTSSSVPEFPSAAVALIAVVALAAVGFFSKKTLSSPPRARAR